MVNLHLLITEMGIQRREYSTQQELIEGCIKREPTAQRKLYEIYAPRMLTLASRYAGDRERAKDILHDGFITLFNKIDSYSGTGSFEGWIRRIFVNMALSISSVFLSISTFLRDISAVFTKILLIQPSKEPVPL